MSSSGVIVGIGGAFSSASFFFSADLRAASFPRLTPEFLSALVFRSCRTPVAPPTIISIISIAVSLRRCVKSSPTPFGIRPKLNLLFKFTIALTALISAPLISRKPAGPPICAPLTASRTLLNIAPP